MKKICIALAITCALSSCKKETPANVAPDILSSKNVSAVPACTTPPAFVGVRAFGGNLYDSGWRVQVDAKGNVTTTGIFATTVDFNPGSGVYNMTFPADLKDKNYYGIFIQKMDARGNFISADYAGAYTGSIPVIDKQGNKYVIGSEKNSGDIVNVTVSKVSPAGKVLGKVYVGTSYAYQIDCVVKLDKQENILIYAGGDLYKYNAAGRLLWKKTTYAIGREMFFDGLANIYVVGVATGGIQKFDTNGNELWLIRNKGQYWFHHGLTTTLTTDEAGNVYAAGEYTGNIDFDPGPGVVLLEGDNQRRNMFIQKISTEGKFIWATAVRCITGGGIIRPEGITLDAGAKNIYITGNFTGVVNFDPAANATPPGIPSEEQDVFVLQLKQCN